MSYVNASAASKPYRLRTTYPLFDDRDAVVDTRSVWEDETFYETHSIAVARAARIERRQHHEVSVAVVDALGRVVLPDPDPTQVRCPDGSDDDLPF